VSPYLVAIIIISNPTKYCNESFWTLSVNFVKLVKVKKMPHFWNYRTFPRRLLLSLLHPAVLGETVYA